MPLSLDVQIAGALAAAAAAMDTIPVSERGDAIGLRELTNATLKAIDAAEPDSPNVTSEDHQISVRDGSSILGRWYTKADSKPGSAVSISTVAA